MRERESAINRHVYAYTAQKRYMDTFQLHRHISLSSPNSSFGFLGDIAIAPATALRYAETNGRSLDDELRVLMLHGVLHLMGYDHESESDYVQMNRIEQKLRRRLGLA